MFILGEEERMVFGQRAGHDLIANLHGFHVIFFCLGDCFVPGGADLGQTVLPALVEVDPKVGASPVCQVVLGDAELGDEGLLAEDEPVDAPGPLAGCAPLGLHLLADLLGEVGLDHLHPHLQEVLVRPEVRAPRDAGRQQGHRPWRGGLVLGSLPALLGVLLGHHLHIPGQFLGTTLLELVQGLHILEEDQCGSFLIQAILQQPPYF
jgi:hypothetical protein